MRIYCVRYVVCNFRGYVCEYLCAQLNVAKLSVMVWPLSIHIAEVFTIRKSTQFTIFDGFYFLSLLPSERVLSYSAPLPFQLKPWNINNSRLGIHIGHPFFFFSIFNESHYTAQIPSKCTACSLSTPWIALFRLQQNAKQSPNIPNRTQRMSFRLNTLICMCLCVYDDTHTKKIEFA